MKFSYAILSVFFFFTSPTSKHVSFRYLVKLVFLKTKLLLKKKRVFLWHSVARIVYRHHTDSFPHLLSPPSASHSPSLLTSYSSSSMADCFWTFTLASSDGSSWERERESGEERLLNRAGRLAFTATRRKWKQTKQKRGKDAERIVARDE